MDCTHAPKDLYSWYARDDNAEGGKVLVITCTSCGEVLQGGYTDDMAFEDQANAFAADIIDRCNKHRWPRTMHFHRKQIGLYVRLNYRVEDDDKQAQMARRVLDIISESYVYA